MAKKLVVVGMDGDDDPADPGMPEKGLDRVRDDRPAADRAVLLRPVGAAGPLAAAGRDDHDGRLCPACVPMPSCHGETHSRSCYPKTSGFPESAAISTLLPGCAPAETV